MQLKRLKEIRAMIGVAQKDWSDIESEMTDGSPLGLSNVVADKRKKLENLLEDIRNNLEMWLFYWDSSIIKGVCRVLLEKILLISEGLRLSYVFPGYSESYYILDTIEMTKR